MLVTEITVLRDQVHLREHVDVGKFKMEHYPERSHEHRDVLRGVRNVVRVAKVHGGQLQETWVADPWGAIDTLLTLNPLFASFPMIFFKLSWFVLSSTWPGRSNTT